MASENIVLEGAGITEAMLATLQKFYHGLIIEKGEKVTLDVQQLESGLAERLALDLEFFDRNPSLPLENLCSGLDNYIPKNRSQEELLEYGRRLVTFVDPSRAAGLYVYGAAGIGKSHICVAVAKEFMRRGLVPRFSLAEQFKGEELRLQPNQVWIIDDLNSGYDLPGKAFTEIVLNAHNRGGRILVTSNKTYEKLMSERFPFYANPADRVRYSDRTESMFKILPVEGESNRQRTAWHIP